MTELIRQWLIFRELLTLAKLESFSAIRPETVANILNRYAAARSNAFDKSGNLLMHTPRLLRSESAMNALISIWELANQQFRFDESQSFRWNAIMASCNSIYNGTFSGQKLRKLRTLPNGTNEPETVEQTHIYASNRCQNEL